MNSAVLSVADKRNSPFNHRRRSQPHTIANTNMEFLVPPIPHVRVTVMCDLPCVLEELLHGALKRLIAISPVKSGAEPAQEFLSAGMWRKGRGKDRKRERRTLKGSEKR